MSKFFSPLFRPLITHLTYNKLRSYSGGVPSTPSVSGSRLRDRSGAFLRDRAGNYIVVRSA